MNSSDISFIIPVYNRPDEIRELLSTLIELDGNKDFEVVIVEDGSSLKSDQVVDSFQDELKLSYYFKPNSGPGDSRNYGMRMARGNYFIILDSDCLIPKGYLTNVKKSLNEEFVDCFGGPDAAHESFTVIQKAINFSMTSILTTGGIRGNKNSVDEFQPRSFNMGLSKSAFDASGGFGRIHPGEDPDLSIRLKKLGFRTKLIPEAFVYHKRRISWSKFYKQVHKFGQVRVILNKWYPETSKITYWFPAFFIIGLLVSLILLAAGYPLPIYLYGIYFLAALLSCWMLSGNILVALLSPLAIIIQFSGYGIGFLRSKIKLLFSDKPESELFPNLFFKKL